MYSRIIVTGGPTREWLDPVRFLSNPSSGKMGIALANGALKLSDEIFFIHGPIDDSSLSPFITQNIAIETTQNLCDAVMESLCENCLLIMAAAPADYTPADYSETKMKKGGDDLTLQLKRTPDILKTVAKERNSYNNITVVGFAAETTNIETYALKKLDEKKLDMICLNDVSRKDAGFGTETNCITIFKRDGKRKDLPLLTKEQTAKEILDEAENFTTE
jgi:phosphopantothenoylcysteine decarboxylase/phosphopantothenate--cysteine ligase